MTGTPFTALEWNDRFQIASGAEIVEVLRPFHEQGLMLRPPVVDLRERVNAAFVGLVGRPAEEIVVFSTQEMEGDIVRLSELLQFTLSLGFKELIQEDMGGIFRHEFQDESIIPGYTVRESLSPVFEATLSESWTFPFRGVLGRSKEVGDEVGQILTIALQAVLSYHIGFLILGRSEEAARVAPFTQLLVLGNPIVGDRGEWDILVVTA